MSEEEDAAAFFVNLAADRAAPELFSALNKAKVGSEAYAFKMRVKEEQGLLEKTTRKQLEKPGYKLSDITDVIGLRVVTLFRSEMPLVVDRILAMVLEAESDSFFVKNSLIEVIVYSSQNVAFDGIVQEVASIVEKRSIDNSIFRCEESDTGYSSIHLVARIDRSLEWPGGKVQEGFDDYRIPIEIQIRTVFEDAWGEIDHKFYKIRRIKQSSNPFTEEKFGKHLRTLKRFADACGEYADAIESDYVGAKSSYSTAVIDINRGESLADRFNDVGVPSNLIELFLEIDRKTKKLNSETVGIRALQPADSFVKLADEYSRLENIAKSNNLKPEADRVFGYYLSMYRALNLLRSKLKSKIIDGATIYESVVEKYPDFPVPLYRLGLALGSLGNYDRALSCLSKALELVKDISDKPVKDRIDQLPDEDRLHLKYNIPKLIGYQYWKKSVDSSDLEKKLQLLQRAFDETVKCNQSIEPDDTKWDEFDEHQITIANNLLYYGVEGSELMNSLGKDSSCYKDDIESQLKFLLTKIDVEQSKDLLVLDTMMVAFDFLQREQEAVQAAGKILELLLGNHTDNSSASGIDGPLNAGLGTEETELVRKAFAILGRYNKQPGSV